MGRIGYRPSSSSSLLRRHFTHPHDLHPTRSPPQNPVHCSGCKLQSSEIMYTCTPCNFTLHQLCANLPHLITHPSHAGCTLSFCPVTTYPRGAFKCNACSGYGDGWSYHCTRCNYDLHVSCAVKPLKIKHQAHPCDLKLTFENPYPNSNAFTCNICRNIGSKQWLYRCESCGFDVHMGCTASYSHLIHSANMGPVPNPYGISQFQGQPVMVPSGSVPNVPNTQDFGAVGGGLGSTFGLAALQGFVEGAFQQVGQVVVQGIIGGGGDDDGGGDGGGGDVGGGLDGSFL